MPAKRKPCIECRVRPKWGTRHRCVVCAYRHMPIDEQVERARFRAGFMPEPLRIKRVPAYLCPPGQRWCAGCQSFRDLQDYGKGATQCRACVSAKSHAARIEKVYGLDRDGYDKLLKLQGGRCAICRNRPKSKRLAVDHDHATGAVRGLLCSRCNHDLMGAAWDSLAMAKALLSYLEAPPSTGNWASPEQSAPAAAPRPSDGLMAPGGTVSLIPSAIDAPAAAPVSKYAVPMADFVALSGVERVPGKRGVWRIYVEPDSDPPF